MKVKKSQICMLAAAVFGVVAIFMMLLNAVTTKIGDLSSQSGESCFAFAFGTLEGYSFNFMMFLPFLLLVVGIVGVVLAFLLKGKLGKFLAMAAFVVAGVLFFCYGAFFSMGGDAAKLAADIVKAAKGSILPGIGAVMAGIFSLVAGVAAALATFVVMD